MSALGQKRSFAPDKPDVRFAPIADVTMRRDRTFGKQAAQMGHALPDPNLKSS